MDKKYTSLEHSIRNIMTETVGVTGKDKPEGTPRSFLKPVGVISPPKGEEHPGTKKTATILAQRGEDKVQHGLKEAAKKLPPEAVDLAGELGVAVKDKIDTLKDLLFPTSKGELVPVNPKQVTNDKKGELVVPNETNQVSKQTNSTEVPTQTTQPQTKTDVEVSKTQPQTQQQTTEVPKVQSQTKTDAKVQSQTKTDVGSTKVQPQIKTDAKVQSQTKTDVGSPKKIDSPKKTDGPKKIPRIKLSIPGINPQTVAGLAGNVPAKQYMHYAQDYVEETQADVERKSIENVARPGGKTRIAKQGEIKAKIIDENAERVATVKKVIADKNSTIIKNPKLKHVDLDEKYTKRIGFGAGLAAGASEPETGLQKSIDKAQQKIDPYNPVLNKKDTWYKSKEYSSDITNPTSDIAMDAYSMIPVVGAVPSAIQAYRNLERGDYLNAGLDALGAIPGVGLLTKGLKFAGKGAAATSKLGKATQVVTRARQPIAHATDVKGGVTAIPPGIIDRASKTGKILDKTADVSTKIANPGNLYQLGSAGGQFGRAVYDAASNAAQEPPKQKEPNKNSIK